MWTKEFCNHFEQFEPLFLVVIFFMGSLYVHFCYESLVFIKGKEKIKLRVGHWKYQSIRKVLVKCLVEQLVVYMIWTSGRVSTNRAKREVTQENELPALGKCPQYCEWISLVNPCWLFNHAMCLREHRKFLYELEWTCLIGERVQWPTFAPMKSVRLSWWWGNMLERNDNVAYLQL